MSGKFLIARFIPNLERGEAFNVGVLVWADGKVRSRFLNPEKAKFVHDKDMFSRWIDYWTDLMSQSRIQIKRSRPVTVRSEKFLDLIQKTQEGNFRLDTGGELPDEGINIEEATRFLYGRLVAKRSMSEPAHGGLREKCDDLFNEVGAANYDAFRRKFPLQVPFGEHEAQIHFHYAIDQSVPTLFHRVDIADESSVAGAAGRFGAAIKKNRSSRDHCFAMFDAAEPGLKGHESYLAEFATPLNVADREKAIAVIDGALKMALAV
jgi:hypothetical protein